MVFGGGGRNVSFSSFFCFHYLDMIQNTEKGGASILMTRAMWDMHATFFFSRRWRFANAAPGAGPPFGLGEVAASVTEPAEGLVLRLRLRSFLQRHQRLDAAGFFVSLGCVGDGARIAAVVVVVVVVVVVFVVLGHGFFAICRGCCGGGGACAGMARSWWGRRRGSEAGAGPFGAAGVAAEIGDRVNESADVAGPGPVVGFGRIRSEVDDRGGRCRFGRYRYWRRIFRDFLCR